MVPLHTVARKIEVASVIKNYAPWVSALTASFAFGDSFLVDFTYSSDSQCRCPSPIDPWGAPGASPGSSFAASKPTSTNDLSYASLAFQQDLSRDYYVSSTQVSFFAWAIVLRDPTQFSILEWCGSPGSYVSSSDASIAYSYASRKRTPKCKIGAGTYFVIGKTSSGFPVLA